MTSTPVKDVSRVLNNLVSSPKSAGPAKSGDRFREVLDDQTGKSPSYEGKESIQKSVNKSFEDSKRVKDSLKSKRTEPASEEDSLREEKIPDEVANQAAVLFLDQASTVMEQIREVFEVSDSDVEAAMEELGMDSLDLLDSVRLGELLLKLSGAEDSFSLVMNEDLYGDFNSVMKAMEEITDRTAEVTGLSKEENRMLLEAVKMRGFAKTEGDALVVADGNNSENAAEAPIVAETAESGETGETQIGLLNQNSVSSAPDGDEVIITAEDLQASTEGSGESDVIPEALDEADQVPGVETNHSTMGTDTGTETEAGAEFQNQSEGKTREKHETNQNLYGRLGTPSIQMILQNLGQSGEVAGAESIRSSFSTDTLNIMKQIMDYMKVSLKPDVTDMQLQLHPASLGNLQIQISSREGMITAHFITQNETVKAALESQMIQLKESFMEQGVKIEAIEVTVQTHQFERNLDQGRGGQNQNNDASRKGRSRRITSGPISVPEETKNDEVSGQELISNDTNTVNYTA